MNGWFVLKHFYRACISAFIVVGLGWVQDVRERELAHRVCAATDAESLQPVAKARWRYEQMSEIDKDNETNKRERGRESGRSDGTGVVVVVVWAMAASPPYVLRFILSTKAE